METFVQVSSFLLTTFCQAFTVLTCLFIIYVDFSLWAVVIEQVNNFFCKIMICFAGTALAMLLCKLVYFVVMEKFLPGVLSPT